MRGTLKICHTAVWTVSSESSSFTSQFHCPLHPSFLLKKTKSVRFDYVQVGSVGLQKSVSWPRIGTPAWRFTLYISQWSTQYGCCSWKIRFFVSKNGYNRSRVIHLARGSFRWHLTVTEFFSVGLWRLFSLFSNCFGCISRQILGLMALPYQTEKWYY